MRTLTRDYVEELVRDVPSIALPLANSASLDPLIERIGNARYVLLGEASHGTSEYYVWRYWLSKRLIEEKGFSFIAVEGDWPDCYRVNRYIKGRDDAGEAAVDVLHAYERWPTWMWANWEIVALAEWMREHNRKLPEEKKVGFFGLDVYSLWESLDAVIRHLEKTGGAAVEAAKTAFQCFEPYGEDAQKYARATVSFLPRHCRDEVVAMLGALRRDAPKFEKDGREAYFVAEQNAIVVTNAETYYRTMVRGGGASWNVRDHHMAETLDRLIRFHGQDAKCIVWEHYTHIGDARATDMAAAGMINIGQLMRETRERDGVYLVGFGSFEGSVVAGYSWGAPMEKMRVPEARYGSWEQILHDGVGRDCLLISEDLARIGGSHEPRGHRAIGVVYDPDAERWGNYAPTVLPGRYDAFCFIDKTRAVHPLHIDVLASREPPETYPWGV
jgi:erythromycin esterase-like protein